MPPALRGPVLAYVVCLASMAAQAGALWLAARGTAGEALARNAALGGLLFMSSDTLLAFNKFNAPVPLSALWILATYWVAQGLIAGSLRRCDGARHHPAYPQLSNNLSHTQPQISPTSLPAAASQRSSFSSTTSTTPCALSQDRASSPSCSPAAALVDPRPGLRSASYMPLNSPA